MKKNISAILLLLLNFINVSSQEKDYKIGLALSGGGAKGFAHIGVLKVLENENIPISAISGVSMGSIVGALYSIGYSADELEKIALTNDWQNLFLDEIKRNDLSFTEKEYESKYLLTLPFDSLKIGLPKGLIQGYGISKLLSRYTRSVHHIDSFYDFPIPFSCLATDLTTGNMKEFTSGYLPYALRASMAIPSLLTPQEIDGVYYIDGFVSRNLPAENVRNMNVDIVIGSDVGENVTTNRNISSLVDVLNQTIGYQGAIEDERQRNMCDILIKPDISGLSASSFDKVSELIKLGEIAALNALPKIKRIIDSLSITKSGIDFNLAMSDSINIKKIIIDNKDEFIQNYLIEELALKHDSTYSITEIEKAIDEIYATKLFEKISYKIIPKEEGNTFVLTLNKRNKDEFRFGMNYNTNDKASLIFNLNLMSFQNSLSRYSIDLKLGEETKVELNYYTDFADYRKGGINLIAGISNNEADIYADELNISKYRSINLYTSVYLGSIFSSVLNTGIGARVDYVNYEVTVSPIPIETIKKNYFSLFSKFEYDNTESRYFPKKGINFNLFAKSYYAIESETKIFLPSIKYGIGFKSFSRVTENMTFVFDSRLLLTNKNLLRSFDYKLDITTDFYGVKKDELSNSNAFMGKVGSQFEVDENNFILIEFNLGNAESNWNDLWDSKKFSTGFGFTYAYNSIFGPLRVSAMTGNVHRILIYASVGFDF